MLMHVHTNKQARQNKHHGGPGKHRLILRIDILCEIPFPVCKGNVSSVLHQSILKPGIQWSLVITVVNCISSVIWYRLDLLWIISVLLMIWAGRDSSIWKHTQTHIQMCSDWSQTRQLHRHGAQIECDFDFSPHFIRNCQIRFHSDDISFTVPQPLWFCFLKKSDGEKIRQLLPSTRFRKVSVLTLPSVPFKWLTAENNEVMQMPSLECLLSRGQKVLTGQPWIRAWPQLLISDSYCCCPLENVLRNEICAPGGKTYCASQFKYICTILWHFVV